MLGINPGEGGIHGLGHLADDGQLCDFGSKYKLDSVESYCEWMKLAQYDGSTHVIGSTTMRELFCGEISLDDPRFIKFRKSEDGVSTA
jgi:hypothetical protein